VACLHESLVGLAGHGLGWWHTEDAKAGGLVIIPGMLQVSVGPRDTENKSQHIMST
jgi:hypothetical protein